MRAHPHVASVVALALMAGVTSALSLGAFGCSHDTDASGSIAPGTSDGGDAPVDTTPKIRVTTLAPAVTNAPAVKASATWAAYSLDDGNWQKLEPTAEGMYAFPLPVARWTIALVCAAGDDALTTVFVHRRTLATTSAEMTLEDYCTPEPPPAEFALAGNLLNVPTTTQWLDFGYARDSRGDAIPAMGGTVAYEEVGIAGGTWDFVFGIRDESFGPLTHVIMRRNEAVTADKTIDIDVVGAGSFVPGAKRLSLHGLIVGDWITPQILYGVGGPGGIDVGPQNVPSDQTDVSAVYATIPEASQIPTDRYRGTLGAEQDRRIGARTITFDMHQAIDLDMTFLPDPPAPVVTVLGVAPQVRLETKFPVIANAARHEVRALAMINRRTQHVWHATFDSASIAGAKEVVDTMPDLSALPGWKRDWGLPQGVEVNVLATGVENPQPLGDGTMQRSAAKASTLTP